MEKNSTKFVKIGEEIRIKDSMSCIDFEFEKDKIYNAKWDMYDEEFIFSEVSDFALPEKLYITDEIDKFKNKVLKRFDVTKKGVVGVMLSGLKGAGKTIIAKYIAKEVNKPIILLDSVTGNGMIKLFEAFSDVDACFIYDEFDKNLDKPTIKNMLKTMDGVNTVGKKLILFTCNEEGGISQYFADRCSRIFYWKKFKEADPSMIKEVINDKLDDKSKVDDVLDYIINNFECISFDNIYSFASEVNINPDDSLDDLFKDMNLSEKL